MRIRRSAIALAMLTLVLMPRVGQSQAASSGDKKKKPTVTLSQNYPNPYNPDTHVPFGISCEESAPGQKFRVTMRIFNVLTQQVAIPELRGSGVAGGQKLENALVPCGQYQAYWNGKYSKSGREVASGVYYFALEIDGERRMTKATTVAK